MTQDTNNRLLRSHDIREMLGVSDMWIWRRLTGNKELDQSFPKPIYLGRNRFWREAEMLSWLDQQAQASQTPH